MSDREDFEPFDFAATLEHETKWAYLLDIGNVDEYGEVKPVWFPKSQTTDNENGTFTCPVWLAKEKGIV